MSYEQILLKTPTAVVLHSAAAALAVPTLVTDGADITGALFRATTDRGGVLSIAGAAALSLTVAILYGWRDSKWHNIADLTNDLNNGNAITLSATLAWDRKVFDVQLYERLAISGTLSASTVTVTYTPITAATATS